jgi:hypothetical protein
MTAPYSTPTLEKVRDPEALARWILKLQLELHPPVHAEGCSAKYGPQYRCRCEYPDLVSDPDYGMMP